jgi:hypothetical protein
VFKRYNKTMLLRRLASSGHRLAASLVIALTLFAAVDAPAGLAIALNSADGTISLIDTETYKPSPARQTCARSRIT